MKTIMLAATCLCLAGCGCDGYDMPKCDGSSAQKTTTSTTDVGKLVYSQRIAPAAFATTITSKGTFSTYTSLIVPVDTAVEMQKITDATTKVVTSQTLFANNKSTLIKTIVELNP